MKFKEISYLRNKKLSLEIFQDIRNNDYVYEVFLKVKKGVKHTVIRNKKLFTEKDILKYLEMQTYISKRPYKLAQSCDGSIGSPVMSLFFDYCKKNALNPSELYSKAYPNETLSKEDIEETFKLGIWQGVEFPNEWREKEFKGLLQSLTNINNHSLVGVLSEL